MIETRPTLIAPADSPGFLLWRLTLRWQRETIAALKPLGLTHVQFVLLSGVAWHARQRRYPSQRELAEFSGTDPMMTSQVLRVLESRGLVTRTPDAQDTRIRRLDVTEEGMSLADRAVEVVLDFDQRFFARSTPDELLKVLRDLA